MNVYKMKTNVSKNGKWTLDHYKEIGFLAFSMASIMYTFGYLVRAIKFHG